MGSIFEAFVFYGDFEEEAAAFLEEKEELFNFDTRHLEAEEDMNVVFVDTSETLDPEVVENIAKELCQTFSKCLYVYWNDEENTSYSMLYDETGFVDMFGEDDEIWVELDENGNPTSKGPRYTRQQVAEKQDPEKSHSCIFSSLDAALLRLDPSVTIKGQALIELDEEDEDDEDDDDDNDESEGFF
jgi:hypothetical protein